MRKLVSGGDGVTSELVSASPRDRRPGARPVVFGAEALGPGYGEETGMCPMGESAGGLSGWRPMRTHTSSRATPSPQAGHGVSR